MRKLVFILLSAALAVVLPSLVHAQEADPIGEPLDPSSYGRGVVETMAEAIRRDEARPPGETLFPDSRNGAHGTWNIPSVRGTYHPHSGIHNAVNKWGDISMGIGFPAPVNVSGAYFNGQAGKGIWAPAIRVTGYLHGVAVKTTAWYRDIGLEPSWFAMNLFGVDRIVIEAEPAYRGAAWYAMDDLTYTPASATGPNPPARVVVSFEDCAYQQKLSGTNYAGLTWESGTGPIPEDDPPGPPQLQAPGSGVQETFEALTGGTRGGGGTAPAIGLNFRGVARGDAGSFSYPPDTCGAVGTTQFVVTVNRNFAVFNKTTGATQTSILLDSFLPGGNGDPRVLFDQYSNRWVVLDSDFSTKIFLAVSLTDDAMGSWFKTNFVASAGSDSGCFPDYPTLGVDVNGLYTGSYMAGCNMTIFAIDKAPLINPAPFLGTVTAFRNLPYEQAIQPVHTYGTPAPPGEYFVSRQSSSGLRVRRLTGPLTGPSLATVATVPVPAHSSAPLVPAMGSATNLDSIDNRLINAVYRNGNIYTCHHLDVGGRAACRWYQISESPTIAVVQSGTVADATRSYWMPSIMVNSQDSLVMGFSGSSPSQFVGAYVTGRSAGDPAGQMAVPQLLKAGTAAQNNIDSFGRNRWGDYSLCSLDPSDTTKLWTVQEYAASENIWSTWVARLSIAAAVDLDPPAPNPGQFEIAPTAASLSSVTMRSNPSTDATPPIQYNFTFEGGGAGGHSSGWQFQADYVDVGLQTNTFYSYSVKTRDSAFPTRNEGQPSAVVQGATAIESPLSVSFASITSRAISATVNGTFTNLTVGVSGVFVEMTPSGNGETGVNQWQQTVNYSIGNLQPNTTYTLRTKARNRLGVETPFSGATVIDTPRECTLMGDVNDDGVLNGFDIDAFLRVRVFEDPLPTDNPVCADYGEGKPMDDAYWLAIDLVNGS